MRRLQIGIPGRHNLLNATAAFLAGTAGLGQDPDRLLAGLAGFTGTRRRFELKGEAAGVRVVDDYAHNPGKVAAVVETGVELAVAGPARGGVPAAPVLAHPRLRRRRSPLRSSPADVVVRHGRLRRTRGPRARASAAPWSPTGSAAAPRPTTSRRGRRPPRRSPASSAPATSSSPSAPVTSPSSARRSCACSRSAARRAQRPGVTLRTSDLGPGGPGGAAALPDRPDRRERRRSRTGRPTRRRGDRRTSPAPGAGATRSPSPGSPPPAPASPRARPPYAAVRGCWRPGALRSSPSSRGLFWLVEFSPVLAARTVAGRGRPRRAPSPTSGAAPTSRSGTPLARLDTDAIARRVIEQRDARRGHGRPVPGHAPWSSAPASGSRSSPSRTLKVK